MHLDPLDCTLVPILTLTSLTSVQNHVKDSLAVTWLWYNFTL